jgi:26S proteasome regulatory subunit N8
MFRKYCPNPVLVVVDVKKNDELNLPIEAYTSVDEVNTEGVQISTFVHVPSSVEAFEAEEVGVEHMLRDVKGVNFSSLSYEVQQKTNSLRSLSHNLIIIRKYLNDVAENRMKPNHQVMKNLQVNPLPI